MEHIFWHRMADELTPLHIAAVKEHFRRMAVWANQLEPAQDWPVPRVEAIPGLRFNLKYVEHWLLKLEVSRLSHLMKRYARQFIHWRAILNPEALPAGLPDLFAPFQLFCSIGGWMDRDHSGSINLNAGSIPGYPLEYYLGKEPFLVNTEESTILVKSSLPGMVAEPLNS